MLPYTLLVVDDEKDFCHVAAAILLKDSYRVERAYSGSAALQILDLQKIELVLLDLTMPVMSGLETLDLIKQKHPTLPVIVMAGDSQPQTAVEAMELGAYDYLSKPVDWERMKTVVRNCLLTSSLEKEVNKLRGELKEKVVFGNVTKIEHFAAPYEFQTILGFSKKIVPLEEIEKEVLRHALKTTNYNMSTTANALGIGRTTLYRKVHKYGIPVPRLNWTSHVS